MICSTCASLSVQLAQAVIEPVLCVLERSFRHPPWGGSLQVRRHTFQAEQHTRPIQFEVLVIGQMHDAQIVEPFQLP